jgi:hypothetical protein
LTTWCTPVNDSRYRNANQEARAAVAKSRSSAVTFATIGIAAAGITAALATKAMAAAAAAAKEQVM